MRRNKRMRALAALFLTACLLSSCAKKEQPAVQETKPYIAVITKSTASNFWKTVYAGVNTASIEYNVNFTFEGPENEEDYVTQNELLKKAIENKARAIVFSAIDYNKSVELIEEASEAGIQILIIDSAINTTKVQAHIGTDNYEAGRQSGEALLQAADGTLSVGIVNFDKNSFNGQERERGLKDVLENNPRASVVSVINVDSNIPDADNGTKKMLEEHPEINAIVTFNEWTTLGVGYAIQELGLADKTTVVGFDNNVISIGMLETGEMDALVVQNPFAMGYLGIETSWALLNGKELSATRIYTETLTATRENLYEEASQKLIFPFR